MKRDPRMLTTADVCERLNVSYSTARRIMSRLRCVDISRPGSTYQTLRVSAYQFDNYVRQRTTHREQ